MVTCPCCKKAVPKLHGNSHILPKWMCKGYLSDLRKVILVDIDASSVNPHAQSAPHGRFWCPACETRSSAGDSYASLVLAPKGTNTLSKLGIKVELGHYTGVGKGSVEAIQYSGINYGLFQQFILSVVLRFELWWRSEKNVSIIGDRHMGNLIELYLSDEPAQDPLRYPIIIEQLVGTPKFAEAGMLSELRVPGNHRGVTFRAAGLDFMVITSSHQKPHFVRETCLKPSGQIIVVRRPFTHAPASKASVISLYQVAQKRRTSRSGRTR
jgi:hypothetical protein